MQQSENIYKTPVIILNGFLGSGKTTLFRNLLSQSKKKKIPVCAIVNDMNKLDIYGKDLWRAAPPYIFWYCSLL